MIRNRKPRLDLHRHVKGGGSAAHCPHCPWGCTKVHLRVCPLCFFIQYIGGS